LKNITDFAADDVERILLANKCDMEEKRMISTARGQEIATQNNIKFYETSAKNNQNINDAFVTLAEDILSKQPKNPVDNNRVKVDPNKTTIGAQQSNCC